MSPTRPSGTGGLPIARSDPGDPIGPSGPANAWAPDGLDEAAFAALVAPLFEAAPRFIARLFAARPLGSWEGLFDTALVLALGMPEDEQLELIDAHPRIGAPPGSVSALSFVEQGYAAEGAAGGAAEGAAGDAAGDAAGGASGDASEGAAGGAVEAGVVADVAAAEGAVRAAVEAERRRVQADLDRLNAAYEERFGFRYVIFVAGRPRAAIVPLMEASLGADRASEIDRALRDVVAIARDRAAKTGVMPDDGGVAASARDAGEA